MQLLNLITLIAFSSFAYGNSVKFREIKTQLDLTVQKNNLNYGESCNPESEKLRVSIRETYSRSMQNGSIPEDEYLQKFIKDLSNLPSNLCSSYKNLQCSFMTRKCECGNFEHFGIRMKFIWQGNKCLIPKGGPCVSPEVEEQDRANSPVLLGNVPKHNLYCEAGTYCSIQGTQMKCLKANIVELSDLAVLKEIDSGTLSWTDSDEVIKVWTKKSKEFKCRCDSLLVTAPLDILTKTNVRESLKSTKSNAIMLLGNIEFWMTFCSIVLLSFDLF